MDRDISEIKKYIERMEQIMNKLVLHIDDVERELKTIREIMILNRKEKTENQE